MVKRTSKRRRRSPRGRNPVARALRDPLFRARREANRRKYSRKAKRHRSPDQEGGEPDENGQP